jgi:5-methylthioadenosine/S-adenosylhomocysteine deaminase
MMSSILIKNGYIVTPKGDGIQIIDDGAIVIEDDTIAAVGESNEVAREYSCEIVIGARKHAIMPGLIDAHIHTSLSLLRGLAQDVPEIEWMHKTVDPLTRHFNKEISIIGSKLCILEAIKSGTTCFCDYGSHMNEVAKQIYQESGVRANICSTINEIGGKKRDTGHLYEFDADIGNQKLNTGINLVKKLHGKANGKITCTFGPQAADMMSKSLLLEIKELANEYRLPIHMHIAQGG